MFDIHREGFVQIIADELIQGKEAVIFDMDGTLIDSMWMWQSIDVEYLARFGWKVPIDLQQRIDGMSFDETAVYFKQRFGITQSIEEMKACWNEMAEEKYRTQVPLKAGAKEFLQYLKASHIKMGIATSNSPELLQIIMDRHGLDRYIDKVQTACGIGKGKPAPDIYLDVARQLEVEPERCLVFEDVVQGVMAGKNAGMSTCAVYDKHSDHAVEELHSLADYYIYDYYEIGGIMQ